MECIVLYCIVLQDNILLVSLAAIGVYNRLDMAHFVVERLSCRDSFSEALEIAEDHTNLKEYTQSIMDDKFPHVAEVGHPITFDFRSPTFHSDETLESVKLFMVCHGQVSSDILKCIIAF